MKGTKQMTQIQQDFVTLSPSDMESYLSDKPTTYVLFKLLDKPTPLLQNHINEKYSKWLGLIVDEDITAYAHQFSVTKTGDTYKLYDLRYSAPFIVNHKPDTVTSHNFKSLDDTQKYIINAIKKDQPEHSWSKYFMTLR